MRFTFFRRCGFAVYLLFSSATGALAIAPNTQVISPTYDSVVRVLRNTGLPGGQGFMEGTGSVVGNIANSGVVAFNRTGTVNYGGVISGTGSVSIAGGATVVFTGNNTYAGGTTLAAGTLQIGNNRLIIGVVKRVHVRDDLFDPDTLRVRADKFNVIGRMAVPHGYCRTRDRFDLRRPE